MNSRSVSDAPQQRRRFGPGRSPLKKAAAARGRRFHNLWYHYSPRLARDVVLRSDLAFAHFCWVESDPRVARYELEPNELAVGSSGESEKAEFDVLVEYRHARPELRTFADVDCEDTDASRALSSLESIAHRAGFQFARISTVSLREHSQLIRNWRCALAFQAACRDVLLAPFKAEIEERAGERRRCSLQELLSGTALELRPKYLAALFGCLQDARLESDLALKPLCATTRISIAEPRS